MSKWRQLSAVVLLGASQSGCSLLFPVEAGESLSHYDAAAPVQGAPAPEFTLTDLHGNSVVLADLVGEKPVVLQLGSYSCPVFRYRRFDMQELQREFAGRVHFVVIYTQEAHPFDADNPYTNEVWNPLINKIAGVNISKHRSMAERSSQAAATFDVAGLEALFLVDGMDNAVWQQYGAAPSAAYVLNLDGEIYLRQPWVYPKEIRRAILELLGN